MKATELRKFEKNPIVKNNIYEDFIISKNLVSDFNSFVENKYAITSNGIESKEQLFLFGET